MRCSLLSRVVAAWISIAPGTAGCNAALLSQKEPVNAPVERVEVPEGALPLSIVPMPAKDVESWEQWVASYKLASTLGVTVAHCYLDWGTMETGPGKYDWQNPGYYSTLAEQNGMKLSVELLIIDVSTLGHLPKDLVSRGLGDLELQERFLAFVAAFAKQCQGDVDYLWIGNEVDTYLHLHRDELDTWTRLHRRAVEIVHREAPGMKVGLSMTYHDALKTDSVSLIHQWGPYSDVIAVTYYPEMMPSGYQPEKIQAQFDGLVEAYGEYPLALVETAVGAYSQFGGGESEQVRYCSELFKALARHESEFVFAGWFNLHDFSPSFLKVLGNKHEGEELNRWFASLALAQFDSRHRPVLRRWGDEARRFYSTRAP